MVSGYLRPLLLLGAGVVVGGVVIWGMSLGDRNPKQSVAAPTPVVTNEGGEPAASQALPSATPLLSPNLLTQTESQPTATPVAQGSQTQMTGKLPLGVSPNAVNYEIYKKLPGVQPPLINYDGRDMGPEALSILKAPREPVRMPGVSDQNQKAMPFPKTVEEINGQVRPTASPSP
jgi:hypothetical protein